MCDIVAKPCKICRKLLPLHLGDYDTDESEVEMYCQDHIPDKDVRIYILKEDETDYMGNIEFNKGTKFGIRSLTDNARKNKDKNHPNTAAYWDEIDLDEKGVEVPIIKKTRAEREKEFKEFIKRMKKFKK